VPELIGPDLLRRLPRENKDIRDTKLTGFAIRCRASGTHSFIVTLGKGQTRTLGKVAKMKPEAARAAAQAMLGGLQKKTISIAADDLSLTRREAREQATREIKVQATRRLTWKRYLDDHYAPWAEAHKKSGAETIIRLRANFKEFNDTPLVGISGFAIEKWRTQRMKTAIGDRTITPATVNRDLSGLRGALTMALRWKLGGLKVHPMADVKATKVDPLQRKRFLSPDEEIRLLDALDARDETRRAERIRANEWRGVRGYDLLPTFGTYTDHLNPLVRLALHTGGRRGELLALRWCDINLSTANLTVRADYAKSALSREIPLNATILEVLTAWKPEGARPDDYVFPGDGGDPMQDIKTAFLTLLKAAKISGFRFHDLRHSFASKLVQAGVDLNTTRELLGHADLTMTLRYAHLSPGHRRAAVDKLVSA
jgi:integrase